MNQIIVTPVSFIEDSGYVSESHFKEIVALGHNWALVGDFGFVGSFLTRKEAFSYANGEAEGQNIEVTFNE